MVSLESVSGLCGVSNTLSACRGCEQRLIGEAPVGIANATRDGEQLTVGVSQTNSEDGKGCVPCHKSDCAWANADVTRSHHATRLESDHFHLMIQRCGHFESCYIWKLAHRMSAARDNPVRGVSCINRIQPDSAYEVFERAEHARRMPASYLLLQLLHCL